ncbi:MAG TPA: 2-hydroxyacid dehydrogenase [Ktedonobacteraceae bacterium]|nr:2-hydroxyacid dehydrogenase [Ktedonobacteraceae bacterium]
MHVVYLEPLPPIVEEIVRGCVPAGCSLRVRRADESPLAIVGDAEYFIVAGTKVTAELIAAAPRLKLIQHQGVGYDNIDVAAAKRAGVAVALAPEGSIVPVAEHTILLILSLYRHLAEAQHALREGRWLRWELRPISYDLQGKVLGIIGMGRIGREVAQRARAFGCHILYTDIVPAPPALEARFEARRVPLETLLREADIVTLHVPLQDDTRHMIGARELGLMKPTALLINAARGGIVDEAALYKALTSGQIAGAGLDVFAQEPPGKDLPFPHLTNVVATPHIAAGTRDAFLTKMQAVFANIQRVEAGEPPLNQV